MSVQVFGQLSTRQKWFQSMVMSSHIMEIYIIKVLSKPFVKMFAQVFSLFLDCKPMGWAVRKPPPSSSINNFNQAWAILFPLPWTKKNLRTHRSSGEMSTEDAKVQGCAGRKFHHRDRLGGKVVTTEKGSPKKLRTKITGMFRDPHVFVSSNHKISVFFCFCKISSLSPC